MMSSSPSSGGRSRFPFTVSQWQELEHQALIFKYMVSGMPVPPDLLFTIKRSLDSALSSSIFPHQHQHHQHQNMGWSYLQMGLGRKVDPEPGRCRRTDGKKWRCSREAFSDSKYCERHMHRGKNRSRKHVENITSPSPPPPSTPSPPTTTPTTNLSTPPQGRARGSGLPNQIHPSPSLINETPTHQKLYKGHHPYYVNSNHTNLHNHSLFPHPSSLRSPGIGIDLSLQESTTQMLLDSGSTAQTDYYRYVHGLKEQSVDERCFFSTGDSRTIKCFSDSRQRNSSVLQQSGGEREYSNYLQLQSLGSSASQQQMQQSTYLLGRNIGSNTQMSQEIDREEDKKQSNIHNFFDEWPPSSRDSWPGSRDKSPVSMTKLSISIPSFNSTTTHNIWYTH